MIEINCIKQAHQLYQSNQLPLIVIQDIAFMFMGACQDIPPNVITYTDIDSDNLIRLSAQLSAEFSFNEFLGGNAYICETESDLTAIVAYDQDWFVQYGRWPNVTDKPMIWDVCNALNIEWAVFAYCWNNTGGKFFYVPKNLWDKAKVSEHLLMSNGLY